MKWTYTISASKPKDGTALLRLRISFGAQRAEFSMGVRVELDKWDERTMRAKPNTTHTAKRIPANYINRLIQDHIDKAEQLFYGYDIKGIIPTATQFKSDFNRTIGQGNKETARLTSIAEQMMKEEGALRQWTQSGYDKVIALVHKINAHTPDIAIGDIDVKWMDSFVLRLTYTEKLNNSTIIGYIKRVKALLRYGEKQGYALSEGVLGYNPRLKSIDRPVIFLTWEELMTVLRYELPFPYLEKARDLFCLSCFTGLRYSDLQKLTPEDIKGDYIEIVTQKTSDHLRIELNDYSKELLNKYDNQVPRLSVQRCNDYIKEVGMYCGVNEPIRTVRIKGGKREETVQPKWQLLSTHAGRRTFICNALMLGIPVNVVMKWTGHSDYEAMRPYICIADEVKKEMMDRFNSQNTPSPKWEPSSKFPPK